LSVPNAADSIRKDSDIPLSAHSPEWFMNTAERGAGNGLAETALQTPNRPFTLSVISSAEAGFGR
jgi:hypothetical protein